MPGLKDKIILILDKNKNTYIETSDEIASLFMGNGRIKVIFKKNDKEYTYGAGAVRELFLKEEVDLSGQDIYIDGELANNLNFIGDYGDYYGILRNRSRKPEYIERSRLQKKRNNAKPILEYISILAAISTENPENEQETEQADKGTFLSSQLKKIQIVADCVLQNYINGNPVQSRPLEGEIIYPFDVNTSQKVAVRQALTHNISIIQGPPGTGKTQSILNLTANLMYRGKSVGIVSNNNSAVENVKEKLEKNGYGFLVAHLGNIENQKKFFQTAESDYIPDPSWELDKKIVDQNKKDLDILAKRVDRLLLSKEELAAAREILSRLQRERQSFQTLFEEVGLPSGFEKLDRWNSEKLRDFKTHLLYFPERLSPRLLIDYLSGLRKFGRPFRLALRYQGSELCFGLDTLIYTKKGRELRDQIRELEQVINSNNLNELLKTYSRLSAELFRHNLFLRYSKLEKIDFTQANYKTTLFEAFLKRFPAIISTTHSILNSCSKPLDYIIIDESSQVDIITASLAFSACRNVVIVGDTQQLPHIVPDEIAEVSDKLVKQYSINPVYDYARMNIIASLKKLYTESLPETLLKEHYRCNPLIIGFCNRKFYRDELICMKDEPPQGYRFSDYPLRIFRTAAGLHGHNKINERQIAVIEHEILPQCSETPPRQIGIISPYRNQADLLTKDICKGTEMEADTIHKFQGREKKIIIFSTVANQIEPFMDKAELVNVAVSRAEEQFIIVTPQQYELQHGSNIGDLIRYIESHNPYGTIESQIVSCFDWLHQPDSNKLDSFRKKFKGTSRYDSENIIEDILNKIIGENASYSGFEIKMGYPLYLMIRNMDGFSEREIRFCQHRSSHVDFVIINRCDDSFILAIEVDGYTYHSRAEQEERDAIKDKALSQNNIELLRLSTRGDREEDKIRKKL